MRSCRRLDIFLLLLHVLPFAGCAEYGDSQSIGVESCRPTGAIEHTIPFQVHSDCPVVNCTLNGNEAVPFLVDTGASTNIIDHEYAESIGVLQGSAEYRSLQGHRMRDVSIGELEIGTLKLQGVRARAMNLGVLSDDNPIKGILGYPLFRQLELCIDYPKRTISLRQGAYRRLERPFNPVFTFVIMPVLVENQGPFNFIFDTGSNTSLVEPHVLAELNPPREAAPVVRIQTAGLEEGFAWPRKGTGSRSEGISTARELVRRACGIRIDGVLGWRHMKDYKVMVNYPTCTYQFEKTGYPPELKPVVVDVTPDLSEDVHVSTKEIVFEFSVPMRQVVSYLTVFHCEERWQDDKHLRLLILDELEADREYEIILGQGFRSKNDVPLDWTPYTFRVVSDNDILQD